MRVAYCEEHNHYPEVLLADVIDSEDGAMVQLDGEGNSNNRWYDDTVGVPKDVLDMVDFDSSICEEHLCEVIWKDKPDEVA